MIRFVGKSHYYSSQMKYTALIAVVLALVSASLVQEQANRLFKERLYGLHSTKSTRGMTPATTLNEDIKYCGTYETECISTEIVSMKSGMKILGMMHKNPIYIQLDMTAFIGQGCTEEIQFEKQGFSGAIKVSNGEQKRLTITYEKPVVTFYMDAAIADLTCTEPLELNKEYDVLTLDCKDSEGNDPFADAKAQVGQSDDIDFIFYEDGIDILDSTNDALHYNRLGDVGCTCASDFFKAATKQFTSLSSPVKNEDVKFCGSYTTGCVSGMITLKADMKFNGMMHRNPIYLTYPVALYMEAGCSEEMKATTMTASFSLKVSNSEMRNAELTYDKITLVFSNEAVISGFTCTEPIELNKEYDIMNLDCKDESGEDPFAENKKLIGTTTTSKMEFGEDYVVVKDEEQEMRLERVSDDGCTCMKPSLRSFFH